MDSIKKAESKIKRLTERLEAAREELRTIIRNTLILCAKCGAESALHSWTFIQDKHYVPPYSCNEGDYWSASEVKLCDIVCPRCNAVNYIFTHPQSVNIIELIDSRGFDKKVLFDVVLEGHRR